MGRAGVVGTGIEMGGGEGSGVGAASAWRTRSSPISPASTCARWTRIAAAGTRIVDGRLVFLVLDPPPLVEQLPQLAGHQELVGFSIEGSVDRPGEAVGCGPQIQIVPMVRSTVACDVGSEVGGDDCRGLGRCSFVCVAKDRLDLVLRVGPDSDNGRVGVGSPFEDQALGIEQLLAETKVERGDVGDLTRLAGELVRGPWRVLRGAGAVRPEPGSGRCRPPTATLYCRRGLPPRSVGQWLPCLIDRRRTPFRPPEPQVARWWPQRETSCGESLIPPSAVPAPRWVTTVRATCARRSHPSRAASSVTPREC